MANQHFRTAREQSKLRWLEEKLLSEFSRQGYLEVDTPILEVPRREQDGVFSLLGQDNELLALRPDFTRAIAAWAAVQKQQRQKYAYFGQVFRRSEANTAGLQVLLQAGVELLGEDAPEAGVAMVALAIDSLRASGASEPCIVLGHTGFLQAAFRDLRLREAEQRQLLQALVSRDLVAWHQLAELSAAPPELQRLPELCGDAAVLDEARRMGLGPLTATVLSELRETLASLTELGYGSSLRLNLGLCAQLDYYSGLLFEGYLPGVGEPVLHGGRYDRLLQQLGADLPATGFAISVDRLLPLCSGGCDRALQG